MRVYTVVFLAGIAAAPVALAHEDVVPYELNGKLITGGHDDISLANNIVQRVFGYDFGEIDPVTLPFYASDPGFNNESAYPGFPGGDLLPAMQTLGVNVLANLQYWDGSGGVSFSAAPAMVELGLNGGVEVLISGTGQSGTVPNIGNTGATGRLHVHFQSRLYFDGDTSPGAPVPDGIYLIGLELTLDGLADSDPFYVVYNNALDEEIHDAAIDWAQMNLVPEPTSYALMAAALVGLTGVIWRKRESRRAANGG